MVLGDGVFGMHLGHENGACMKGINVLVKKT
jgi:hypothetical protein